MAEPSGAISMVRPIVLLVLVARLSLRMMRSRVTRSDDDAGVSQPHSATAAVAVVTTRAAVRRRCARDDGAPAPAVTLVAA